MKYPTALDLMALIHCSACGDTDPESDDGTTACCTKRVCNGADPAEAQDMCCHAVTERMEAEQKAGGTPARAADVKPTPPPARPAARRKAKKPRVQAPAKTDETQGLQAAPDDANLVSHPGGDAPSPTDTKEPDMAATDTTEKNTSAVCTALFKDKEDTFEPVGHSFGKDRAEFELLAKSYLFDKTELASSTADGADWDEVFEAFNPKPAEAEVEVAPAAPIVAKELTVAPKKSARRAALGPASAPGWELLYDKPKQDCEVGRMYVGTKPTYSLICKTHGHVRPLRALTAERAIRTAGGWCPECSK